MIAVKQGARRGRVPLLILIIASLSGCSEILESERRRADHARVVVTGQSAVPLMLVTSTRFARARNEDGQEVINLIVADTTNVALPADKTVKFGESDRFVVILQNPNTDVTADITMVVTVDGQEVYRQAATLRDASLRFTYYLF